MKYPLRPRSAGALIVALTYAAVFAPTVFATVSQQNSGLRYTFIDLTPDDDSITSEATAVNKAGHVVGWDDSGAFVYMNGSLTHLSTFGHQQSYATSINDRDEIVGYVRDFNGTSFTCQGFLFYHGTVTWLPAPPGLPEGTHNTIPCSISSRGEIVGTSWTDGMSDHRRYATAWIYGIPLNIGVLVAPPDKDTFGVAVNAAGKIAAAYKGIQGFHSVLLTADGRRVLLDPGHTSMPIGINVDGDIVGAARAGQHAFLWSKGTLTLLPEPAFTLSSFGRSINQSDQIVGEVVNDGGEFAFLWEKGGGVDLNTITQRGDDGYPVLYNATGINESGQICGNMFADGTLITHAFLLQPIIGSSSDQD